MRVAAVLGFIVAITLAPAPSLEAGQWSQLFPTTAPPARMFAGMAYDEARGRLVLFGGTPSFERATFFNDTWEWDGTQWSQVQTPNSPPSRHAMYMAYDSDRDLVVLFGGQHGFGGGSSWDDTWEYDGIDWTQVLPAVTPGPRGEGAMAFDRDRHVMVLYGGHIGGGGDLNDTWEYDGTTWRQVNTPSTPSLANNQGMVYDQARHRIVMHGGCGNGNRAWLYDGATWSSGASGPAGRNVHSMGYYPPTSRTVVFGGSVDCSYQLRQDTWEWNGIDWTEVLPTVSPSARWGMALAYVPSNGGLVGFGGGSTGAATAETWLYTPSCPLCDSDSDGYDWPADCNDADPMSFPGAAEICDGRDNDCDDAIDNNPSCIRSCDHPGRVGPAVRITTSHSTAPWTSVAWNGTEYATVWSDSRDGDTEIYFARFDYLGSPIGPSIRMTNATGESYSPRLVWTGEEYGVVWSDRRDGNGEIYFALLSNLGAKTTVDIRITSDPRESRRPDLVWTGHDYGITWWGDTVQGSSIYFTRVDASGATLGPNIRVTDTSYSEDPVVVWTGNEFGLAFFSSRDGPGDIYFARVDAAGMKIGEDVRVTLGAHPFWGPSMVWALDGYAISWDDSRYGNHEIAFARLGLNGIVAGPEVRVTSDSGDSFRPILTTTGTEYGVSWWDSRDGDFEIYFARLDPFGVKIGDDVRISNDPDSSSLPVLIWSGVEFGVVWSGYPSTTSSAWFGRIGCSCPPEVCDGLDQDCDGLADEGLGQSTCGLGACTTTVDNCVAGVSQICTPGPATLETCDVVDNDCNGQMDDGDADGDGYLICMDCNDTNASINPGTQEVCNTADDNCNGLIDDDPAGLDSDSDGIHNACDNCRFAYNPTQVDGDQDGLGNACDNCVFISNPGQADLDGDQRGDLCDNCPAQFNPFQDDIEGDRVGDVCDNCPFDPNTDQGDSDNDFEGNVCDLDDALIWITLPDGFTVAWQQEIGFDSFNVYQSNLAVLKSSGLYTQDPATVLLASRACDVTDGFVYYDTDPGPGQVVFFLVTGNHLGLETSLGINSAGVERFNANPCP